MKLYHRTPQGARILRYGFKDSTGRYLTSNQYSGVWFSNVPLNINEGAKGMTVLAVKIPVKVIRDFEWIEDGKPYREWLIPAAIANQYGPPVVFDHDLKGWSREGIQRMFEVFRTSKYDRSAEERDFRRELAFARRVGLVKA